MKPLCAKEIRLLQPAWLMALLLAVVPVWLLPGRPYHRPEEGALVPLIFGLVMLALSPFGREFGLQTFGLQLAQPMARRRLWWVKSGLLAAAILTVFLAWLASCLACLRSASGESIDFDTLVFGAAAAVVAYAGGLWTTLLLRQVAAAFWFTILVPGAVAMFMNEAKTWQVLIVLGLYAIAGFWWARRQFLAAQETSWTGGVIAFPGFRGGQTTLGARMHRPLAALCWKEIQLHQVGLAGMAWLFLMHLGAVWLRRINPENFSETVRTVLEVFGGVWIIVPLLVSSVAVAEERKLGTLSEQLSLPVSRRVQFALKLGLTLVIGGVLSAALVCSAEGISSAIGATGGMFGQKASLSDVATLFGVFLGTAFLGFYASTLSRNLVQALAAAVVSSAAVWILLAVAPHPAEMLRLPLWRGYLVYYLGIPALLVTLPWLAWHNFRSESASDHLWRHNGLVAGSVLAAVILLTLAIYHRSWELLTPVDPSPGRARITSDKPTVLWSYGGSGLTAILPDGRLWVDRINYEPGRQVLSVGNGTGFRLGGKWVSLSGNQIVAGSNWVKAIANFRETVALRSDGTLWISAKPRPRRDRDSEVQPIEEPSALVRFGSETNWSDFVQEHYPWSIVLLKQDGTLWRLGTNSFGEKHPWPGLGSFAPQRLVAEDGWGRILRGAECICAWKRDGTAWAIHSAERGDRNRENELGVVLDPVRMLDQTTWRAMARFVDHQVALREDGTLWAWPILDRFNRAANGQVSDPRMRRIAPDSDWVALGGEYQSLVARKSDGSVWCWTFPGWDHRWNPFVLRPTRLGSRHDWVAVAGGWGGVLTLAADGNLYYWWNRGFLGYNGDSDQPMLAPTRKPVLVENIFAGK